MIAAEWKLDEVDCFIAFLLLIIASVSVYLGWFIAESFRRKS